MSRFGRKIFFSLALLMFPLLLAGAVFLTADVFASSMDLTVTVTSAICGNSIIETGEQCDNGASNGACPAACSSACQTNSCGGGGGETTLTITDLTVVDITESSATINWKTSEAALCVFRYGLDTAYASSTIIEPASLSDHSLGLSGLSRETTYHFHISCSNSLGAAAATVDNTFLTLSVPVVLEPLAISDLAVSNVTDKSADVGWSTNRPAACQLRWGTNTDYSGGASSEVAYSASHLSPLTGLLADTDYHFIISCRDSEDNATTTPDNIFKTLVGPDITPPGNVTGLRSLSGNATSTLFWRNPADADFAGVIIRRSTVYYPTLTQGVMVYDGQGNLIGDEMSFADTGLTNGTIYYYTVFAYDLSGNYASGRGVIGRPLAGEQPPATCETDPSLCPPATCETDPSLCPPPATCETDPSLCPSVGDLYFTDFNFFQQSQLLPISSDNRVAAQPGYDLTVVLPAGKVLAGTAKMVLNLSVGGKIETYLFAYDPGQKNYSAVISAISDAGVYYVSIVVLDAQDKTLKTVSGSIEIKAPEVEVLPSLPAAIGTTAETVAAITEAVREAPVVKAISQAAESPAGQTAAAVSVAASFATTAISIPLMNWWFLLQFIFTQPLKLLWFRKGWGTVYNSITKKPVDLALVRLYDAKTDRLLTSRVTDRNGRYIFLVNPGEYYIKVEKLGFDYPSALLKRVHDDGSYSDLYYGEKITITGEERSAIIANIPLDQQDAKLTDAEVLRRFSRARLSRGLSWLGPLLALAYFLFYPSIYSGVLIVVHVFLLFLFRRLAGRKHKKHWGVVYNPDGKNPIKQAITRVFSSEYGRMLEFYVTDDRGRYDFLVGNNKYYVTADKPGFGTAKTPILDLTGKKPEELAIAQDLILPKLDESANAGGSGGRKTEEAGIAEKTAPPEAKSAKPEIPEKDIIAEKPAEPIKTSPPKPAVGEKAEPVLSAAPPVGSLDLGSIDEIREQMENKAPEPPAAESETKPAAPSNQDKKSKEGIYG